MSFGDVSQYSRTSGFDEEHVDPHGECAAEIHRLQAKNAALKAEVATLTDQRDSLLRDMQAAEKAWDEARYE